MTLMERLEQQKMAVRPEEGGGPAAAAQEPEIPDAYAPLEDTLHTELIDYLNHDTSDKELAGAALKDFYKGAIDSLITAKGLNISRTDRQKIIGNVYNDVIGLGPLEPLLEDAAVTEIMVNGAKSVYVERRGLIELTRVRFRDDEHLMNVITRIVSSVGRRIDESSPMVDARLADGSRVNAIIPPVCLTGPSLTIRKFSRTPLTVSDLVRFSSVSPQMMSFLEACVKARLNIIVSGGTGSGKTTLLSVLSAYIPENERIVTIEDAAELQLRQRHVVTLEARPANTEGMGEVTIRSLVRNALRMRPDRIIVGEVRSGETLDMLQAMNTGHDGSMTTAHANTPRDLLSRLETMVLMSGMEIPLKAVREQIASALDIIVHQARMKDGSRKITNITEVVGMEGDTVVLQDIYTFVPEGFDGSGMIRGSFRPTGIRPSFTEKLTSSGVLVRDDWFRN
ncbi:MAG: CpaF family protein [Oscillospiraceae bacterium]|nr:CpaF family protein [Oscillospiraceae bacterium]